MAQRYKINGIVEIPAGVYGPKAYDIDSPEFEITQGRLADNTTFTGVTFYFNQGTIPQEVFVEFPRAFAELTPTQLSAVVQLITEANHYVLSLPFMAGATPI